MTARDGETHLRQAATPKGISPARKVTLLFIASLTIMSGATIAPALPGIEAQFAETPNAALLSRLVLTLPALLIALCAPLAGSIADHFGRRRLLIASIVLYGFAGMSGLVLDSLATLLLGRALLGVAVAGTMTTATALVGDYFSGDERDRFMGLQAAFVGLGGLVFLTAGGLLADSHWRAPFAIYGAAFVLLPAVALFIFEPPHRAGGRPPPAGPLSARPLQLAIGAIFAVAMLNSVAFYLIPTQLPFYLRALEIAEASKTGLAIGLFNLTAAVLSLAYGRIRRHCGVAAVFGISFALMATGIGLVAAAESFTAIAVSIAVAGIGMGLVMPNLFAGAMALSPPAVRGRIAGGLTASIFIGQFVSPLVSQPWIASFGFAAAFRDTAILLAGIAVGALLVAAAAARRERLRSSP